MSHQTWKSTTTNKQINHTIEENCTCLRNHPKSLKEKAKEEVAQKWKKDRSLRRKDTVEKVTHAKKLRWIVLRKFTFRS